MKKWTVLDKKILIDSPMFKFWQYHLKHGDKNTEHDFFILDTRDWVNIVALTVENELVLIRQYRAGVDEITIEIPGGIIDDGENILQAAKRELEEETAYIADDFIYLGYVYPVPSFITNKNHFVFAKNARQIGKLHFDPSEYIETFTAPVYEVYKMVENGEIKHGLTIAALFKAKKYLDPLNQP